MASANTPRDAKLLAREVSAMCFNDEIRAHVARELLAHIVTPHDVNTSAAFDVAYAGAGRLVAAFDQQNGGN